MNVITVGVEVHGNDGMSHRAAAETFVRNRIPGACVVASRLTDRRCAHAYSIFEVDYVASETKEVSHA